MSITDLPDALRSLGVMVSVELQDGRPGVSPRFVGTLGHHTAGGAAGMTPSLGIIKRGRPGLPGPLSNGYLGRDLIARVITYGGANHPGAGGPVTLAGLRVPANQGRVYLFGWEHEHPGRASDAWSSEFLDVCSRCHAATLRVIGRDERSHLEHQHWATPPGRKPDRRVPLHEERARIAAILGRPHVPAPVVPAPLRAPAFPLPAGWYFGPRSGPRQSVSGYWSHRADLRRWQQRMWERGWRRMAVDGLYGEVTADLTRQFQREKRLGVDGLIGPATWRAAWEAR